MLMQKLLKIVIPIGIGESQSDSYRNAASYPKSTAYSLLPIRYISASTGAKAIQNNLFMLQHLPTIVK